MPNPEIKILHPQPLTGQNSTASRLRFEAKGFRLRVWVLKKSRRRALGLGCRFQALGSRGSSKSMGSFFVLLAVTGGRGNNHFWGTGLHD